MLRVAGLVVLELIAIVGSIAASTAGYERAVFLVATTSVFAFLAHRWLNSLLLVTDDGIVVRNPWRVYDLRWNDIASVETRWGEVTALSPLVRMSAVVVTPKGRRTGIPVLATAGRPAPVLAALVSSLAEKAQIARPELAPTADRPPPRPLSKAKLIAARSAVAGLVLGTLFGIYAFAFEDTRPWTQAVVLAAEAAVVVGVVVLFIEGWMAIRGEDTGNGIFNWRGR